MVVLLNKALMEQYIFEILVENIIFMSIILMFCNGFFSFPPSEIILSMIGYICFTYNIIILPVIFAALLGNLIGTSIWYFIGIKMKLEWVINLSNNKWLNTNKYTIRMKKYIMPNKEDLNNYTSFFRNNGAIWIGILRCFPLVRSIVSLPAGMIQMKPAKYFLYTTLGISVWIFSWIYAGFTIGRIWESNNSYIVLCSILGVIAISIAMKILLKKIIKI